MSKKSFARQAGYLIYFTEDDEWDGTRMRGHLYKLKGLELATRAESFNYDYMFSRHQRNALEGDYLHVKLLQQLDMMSALVKSAQSSVATGQNCMLITRARYDAMTLTIANQANTITGLQRHRRRWKDAARGFYRLLMGRT